MKLPDLLEIKPLVDIKVIIESLTRIGIANKTEKILYPSCYLWPMNETTPDTKYHLVSFKQLFILTRNDSYDNISKSDIMRRNAIAFCLMRWNLISIPDESQIKERETYIFVLPFSDKPNWRIQHKINLNSLYNLDFVE
jgi:hypothetical protein